MSTAVSVPDRVLLFSLDRIGTRFPIERMPSLCGEVIERLLARGGIVSASCSTMSPADTSSDSFRIQRAWVRTGRGRDGPQRHDQLRVAGLLQDAGGSTSRRPCVHVERYVRLATSGGRHGVDGAVFFRRGQSCRAEVHTWESERDDCGHRRGRPQPAARDAGTNGIRAAIAGSWRLSRNHGGSSHVW